MRARFILRGAFSSLGACTENPHMTPIVASLEWWVATSRTLPLFADKASSLLLRYPAIPDHGRASPNTDFQGAISFSLLVLGVGLA